jgi:hypothetical protein
VLRYEAKFAQLGVTQKDAQFAEGLNMTFRQVARAYGMQSPLLNDLEHATLANAREFERIEWAQTLQPDANFKAADVREQYLPRFKGRGGPVWCEFDYTKVPALQESESEAWTREAQALDRGALTINEWRARKGLPAVDWGDRPWMPVNKAQVGEDGMLKLPEGSTLMPDELDLPGDADFPEKAPDDEANPSGNTEAKTDPRAFEVDHMTARRLLAQAFGTPALNGHTFH